MASKDIVDTAVANGSFKTLAAALQAAGLVETLKGNGPFTVFAPTDAAFAKLPAGTVETLLKPENKEKLRQILTYHVVAGKGRILGGHQDDIGQGGERRFDQGWGQGQRRDGERRQGRHRPDVAASNGVIHVIDSVLMPPAK